jgi:hypothetical protein
VFLHLLLHGAKRAEVVGGHAPFRIVLSSRLGTILKLSERFEVQPGKSPIERLGSGISCFREAVEERVQLGPLVGAHLASDLGEHSADLFKALILF